MRRLRAAVGWGGATVVVGALAFWAGSVVAAPVTEPEPAPTAVAYEVTDGEVGFTQRFTATAQWPVARSTVSPATGTVTSVELPQDGLIASGAVLYTVDMRPVVVIDGTVPAYRDLSAGMTGEDVRELQQFLVDQRGAALSADGRFGSATVKAVRAWQRELGITVDGVVRLGDLLVMPDLPRPMVAAESLALGAVVNRGDPAIKVLATAPVFTLQVSPLQRTSVPEEAELIVHSPAGDARGVVTSADDLGDGTVLLELAASDGGSLCGGDCGWVPLGGPVNVSVEFLVVPFEQGPVIPVAAITTHPDGSTWVEVIGRGAQEITVVTSSGGLAVVSGVRAGEEVSIPAGRAP